MYFLIDYFFKKRFYSFTLERGEVRETSMWEKHQSVVSCMHPNQDPSLQPRHEPWPGIEPVTFGFVGQCPTNWATPVRAIDIRSFKKSIVKSYYIIFQIFSFLHFVSSLLQRLSLDIYLTVEYHKALWCFLFFVHSFLSLL